MHTILVTGSTGFIGKRLCQLLRQQGFDVREFVRSHTNHVDINNLDALITACQGIDTLFHCAGYAHALDVKQEDEANKHWHINYQGTVNVCTAAKQAGVARLIFASSVKAGLPEDMYGQPDSPYGLAKRAAEDAVLELQNIMHVVNVRFAMVYGAEGRGNLQRMAKLIKMGFFPPLPETHNRRSLVHVDDAVDALLACATNHHASAQTLIVAHQNAPSGRMLYDALREALGLPKLSGSFPHKILVLFASIADFLQRISHKTLPFNSDVLSKLLDSEYYDPTHIKQLIGWQARIDLKQGLTEMLQQREC